MKFGYVIHIGHKLYHKLFQSSNSKIDWVIDKNCFRTVYIEFTFINPLLKVKNEPKFGEILKVSLSYLKKILGDMRLSANP